MTYLCHMYVFALRGETITYCVVFLLCFSCVLLTICCQFLWIVNFDCPFGIL